MLPAVIVNGIPTVHRAVLNKVEKPAPRMNLLIDGTGLLQVMGTVGVDHTKTVTNHVLEINSVLGIEAARTVLIQEVSNTYRCDANSSVDMDRTDCRSTSAIRCCWPIA